MLIALLSGASAGLCTDLALFPLDTIKTRLQSSDGFAKAGGFRGIYAGLGSAAIGSMPGAALFFCTYESIKVALTNKTGYTSNLDLMPIHMLAASCGEVVACVVRVPTEIVKQRAQATLVPSIQVLKNTLLSEGPAGLYRGYLSTVLREIPFSLIQFPLWELLKHQWSTYQQRPVDPWQSAVAGSLAGSISAAITTPLDVAKTRIMLASKDSKLASGGIVNAIRTIFSENGVRGLFAGIGPRVLMISLGGFIFLGSYEKTKFLLSDMYS